MNHFRTPLPATSVTMRHSSPRASAVCAGRNATHILFTNHCEIFVASRRAASEVGLRLRDVLALAVVCAAFLYCASSASAQTTNGVVTAWGDNSYGQCNISASSGVSAIAGGDYHTIALKNGEVLAWGENGQGQCTIPASASSGVSAIAGGSSHTIALKNGEVLAWGRNLEGQCTIPASASSGVSAIAGRNYHTIALKNGAVLAWGYNYYGQCKGTDSGGNPITSYLADGNVPVQINGITLTGVSAIAGGSGHTIALKNGEVLAWGLNVCGQCNIPAAAQIGVTAIAGGYLHTIALKMAKFWLGGAMYTVNAPFLLLLPVEFQLSRAVATTPSL